MRWSRIISIATVAVQKLRKAGVEVKLSKGITYPGLLRIEKYTPEEFVEIITELRNNYLTRKAAKRAKLSRR